MFNVWAALKLSLPIIMKMLHAREPSCALDGCSNNLLNLLTLEWPVSWDSLDSYISIGLHACDTILKYFPGFSPEFNRHIHQRRYIRIVINTLRPEQWSLTFCTHFQGIFLLKINLNLSLFPSVRLAHWLIYYGLTPIRRQPTTCTIVDSTCPSALMKQYWFRLIKTFERCISSSDILFLKLCIFNYNCQEWYLTLELNLRDHKRFI